MRFFFITLLLLEFTILYPGNPHDRNTGIPKGPERKIVWEGIATNQYSDHETYKFLQFKGASYNTARLPEYFERIKLAHGTKHVNAEISNAVYAELTAQEAALVHLKETELKVESNIGYDRKEPYALIHFVPIRKNPGSGKYEKLVSFKIELKSTASAGSNARVSSVKSVIHAQNSVLASGDWFRIGVTADGVYQLSYTYLKKLGLNMDQLAATNFRLFGNGGGQLSYNDTASRKDDLTENAIVLADQNSNNIFDSADYVLFYGMSQTRWSYTQGVCPAFQHKKNLYSDTTYYFITTSLGPGGKRIQTQASSVSPATVQVSSFDDYAYTEDDAVNLIQSGREWFGETYDILLSYQHNYSFANVDNSIPVTINVDMASRLDTTNFYLINAGTLPAKTLSIPGVNTGLYYGIYAAEASTCFTVSTANLPSGQVPVTITQSPVSAGAVGWLRLIDVNVRRLLTMNGDQLFFRDSKSVGKGSIAQFQLKSSSSLQIWEITNPFNVKLQNTTLNGGAYQFSLPADTLRQFVAFTGNSFGIPFSIGAVPNQNLHSLPEPDLVIVAHPLFWDAANTLAEFHRTNDNLNVVLVSPQEIYNEFSSGSQDVSAIRDFMKMFYDRSTSYQNMPKYLQLFGAGSYDNLYRLSNNSNYIPTWQSSNSLDPTASYVSDDFYGLLDDGEGDYYPTDLVDIGIARLPAYNPQQATGMVNKIIKYAGKVPLTPNATSACPTASTASTFGDWRNLICFVADTYPPDGDIHESQADQEATIVDTMYKDFNINKIYLDAFPVVSTPGGDTYPAAEAAIDQQVSQGALIVNYTGHGGQLGWSHDRVLGDNDINNWTNLYTLPLFITATCEFSTFDNPALISAGELVMLNANGGGIGLFTTVRLVYSTPNFYLNSNFYLNAFEDSLPNGQMARMGDQFRVTKVSSGIDVNNRNFTFLGDPALRLNYPQYNIATDSIYVDSKTGHKLGKNIIDTLKALSKVTMSGRVTDKYGNLLSSYNGYIFPSVYDKPTTINTLGTENVSVFPFQLQKNVLYKGSVSVKNGRYRYTFVVPKDIAYNYGVGKVSYYGQGGATDASGYCEQFYIGGTSKNSGLNATAPGIKLYMNDSRFVFGGITDQSPYLYALLKDSSGINTVGNGIGHDLTAVLDGNTENTIVLNDYYQSDLNSYRSGTILYPFQNLSPGKHTLLLKVWNIYNISATAYTEFTVAGSGTLTINNILNYPNPFTTNTSFYFENNRCCEPLDVQIQIFTVTGRLVKHISERVTLTGFRSGPIPWNGKDDFGDNIGRGVYVYHVKVRSDDGSVADKYEKLVILN